MNKERKSVAVYAGSFDPFTNGHFDITRRAGSVFDRVIVAVANNPSKKNFFSVSEREEMIASCLESEKLNYEVASFDGLLVEFCRKIGAGVIIRGLRAVSDYEYESQLAITNRQLAEDVETVFLMTSKDCSFISSSVVREISSFGGDVSELVPKGVLVKLSEKQNGKS